MGIRLQAVVLLATSLVLVGATGCSPAQLRDQVRAQLGLPKAAEVPTARIVAGGETVASFLALKAQVNQGLLDVYGINVSRFQEGPHQFYVINKWLAASPGPHTDLTRILREDGQVALRAVNRFQIAPTPQLVSHTVVVPIQLNLTAGTYWVVVQLDGRTATRYPFTVVPKTGS